MKAKKEVLVKVTLQEYIRREKESLDKFEQYWKAEQKKDSEVFPKELAVEDWVDQYFDYFNIEELPR